MNHTPIAIEKGIPIPDYNTKPRGGKYPFESMEIGDSFEVEGKTTMQMTSVAGQWKRVYAKEKKFSVRKTEKGVRIWRTK